MKKISKSTQEQIAKTDFSTYSVVFYELQSDPIYPTWMAA